MKTDLDSKIEKILKQELLGGIFFDEKKAVTQLHALLKSTMMEVLENISPDVKYDEQIKIGCDYTLKEIRKRIKDL